MPGGAHGYLEDAQLKMQHHLASANPASPANATAQNMHGNQKQMQKPSELVLGISQNLVNQNLYDTQLSQTMNQGGQGASNKKQLQNNGSKRSINRK